MKVKKYIDPFSSQVHKMAKKFDVATIENKIEDMRIFPLQWISVDLKRIHL